MGWERGDYSEAAQDIPAEDDKKRRWVAIYSIPSIEYGHATYEFLKNPQGRMYGVVIFEIPKSNLGGDDNLYAEGVVIINSQGFDSNKEMFEFLDQLNIDIGLFTYPWRCEFPL